MKHDDKYIHPSAVSLSVSLLVRTGTGSAGALCQGDKVFCDKQQRQKKMEGRRKSKNRL